MIATLLPVPWNPQKSSIPLPCTASKFLGENVQWGELRSGVNANSDVWNRLQGCVHQLSCHQGRIPVIHSLKEQSFILASGLMDLVCERLTPRQKCHGGMVWGGDLFTTLQPRSRKAKAWIWTSFQSPVKTPSNLTWVQFQTWRLLHQVGDVSVQLWSK